MPNELNNYRAIGVFSFKRGWNALSSHTLTAESILVKMRLSSVRVHDKGTYLRNKFVWRQLGVAFFGAVTSVAALFVCTEKTTKRKGKKNEKENSIYYSCYVVAFDSAYIV